MGEIVMNKEFLASEKAYLKNKNVKKVIKSINEDDDGKNGKKYMLQFKKLLSQYYKEDYPMGVNVEQLFELKDFHTAGMYSGLPHHLSKVDLIAELGNAVEEVLNELMDNKPVHVTLATSRADRYLPDCQAAIIYDMVDQMMEALYGSVRVTRMDKPEFSICFAPASDEE
eukprot:TRINITY_DN2341_c0_g1_i1.p1 TRINITY_DN2341_c0_g1~~TRINITY_DN2341_c0_g1_i1.p1  ORF type:complete len:170 (+),score=44.98 TRINITY_DN2341_c0_g1_i1:56-565(+)